MNNDELETKLDEFSAICNDLITLYSAKNKNYGDSFGKLYKELGPISGLVPLYNKLHRLTSLLSGNENNFESIEDTFKDLASYAIMNLIEYKANEKPTIGYKTIRYTYVPESDRPGENPYKIKDDCWKYEPSTTGIDYNDYKWTTTKINYNKEDNKC